MPPASTQSSQGRLVRFAETLHGDSGGAAVSFIIAFPIFLWIVAILVQYALIVNAKVLIDFSTAAAARSAVTSLPEGHPENVRSAAYMSLEPLSPIALEPISDEADTMYQALQTEGVNVSMTFPARYTYAMDATTVSWSPNIDFTQTAGTQTDVTVVYNFKLTVPGAMRLVGTSQTIGGIKGRFLAITSTSRVETSHSRKTQTDGTGWPG